MKTGTSALEAVPSPAPGMPPLRRGRVAVFGIWIGGEPGPADARLLAEDERQRAAAFVFDLHRHRYVNCRAALRRLLGSYLRLDPAQVRFAYSSFGKPEVAGSELRFNLAHCDDLALVCLTPADRVGVDIERVRPVPDVLGVASTVFSKAELQVLHAAGPAEVEQTFFNCWTRKEAFVKAVGEGLSYPLKVFDVTLRPGEEARLVRLEDSADKAGEWSLFDLRPLEGWAAAVVVERRGAGVVPAGWLRTPPGYGATLFG